MYTLRTIDPQNREANKALGQSYTVLHFERNPEQFNEVFEINDYHDKEKIHCVVFDENGRASFIYKTDSAYIMTDNGKTFSNLTYK